MSLTQGNQSRSPKLIDLGGEFFSIIDPARKYVDMRVGTLDLLRRVPLGEPVHLIRVDVGRDFAQYRILPQTDGELTRLVRKPGESWAQAAAQVVAPNVLAGHLQRLGTADYLRMVGHTSAWSLQRLYLQSLGEH